MFQLENLKASALPSYFFVCAFCDLGGCELAAGQLWGEVICQSKQGVRDRIEQAGSRVTLHTNP